MCDERRRDECPFCRFVQGIESRHNALADIVYADDELIAFVPPRTWPRNAGNVLIVPRTHGESLYSMPDDLLGRVIVVARQVAVAMKSAYACDGTSLRQHNESAGGQDVFHLHLHVLPRWEGNELYQRHDEFRYVPAEERQVYAARLQVATEARREDG